MFTCFLLLIVFLTVLLQPLQALETGNKNCMSIVSSKFPDICLSSSGRQSGEKSKTMAKEEKIMKKLPSTRKKFTCSLCRIDFSSHKSLERHKTRQIHLDAVFSNKKTKKTSIRKCELCNWSCLNHFGSFFRHLNSAQHRNQVILSEQKIGKS